MSTSTAKRPLERSGSPMAPATKGSKPGRKPLDDEAKSKRTAQNRAAQRAFRERKEKKMKELEDKVRSLEQSNRENVVESEFLRSQLLTLVNELKRYRPPQAADLQVLDYLAKHERADPPTEKEIEQSIQKKMDFTFAFPWKDRKEAEAQQFPSPGSSMLSSSSASMNSAGSPTNKRRSATSQSTSTSTSTTGWMDNVFYSDDAQKLPQFSVKPELSDDLLFSNQFNFDDQFDEQVSQFCSKMSQACGTRECPIPSATPQVLTNSWETGSSPGFGKTNFGTLKMPSKASPAQVSPAQVSPAQSDVPFIDPAMAFPTEDDDQQLFFRSHRDENNLFAELLDEVEPTDNFVDDNLINEEPAAPPAPAAAVPATIETDKTKDTEKDTRYSLASNPEESDVVPSRDGKLLKCSEVWDRITSHPKYSDIDIDGLCGELMTKAKCSEKGVVVQAEDVQRVLNKHMDT